jgi:hypothetical protein
MARELRLKNCGLLGFFGVKLRIKYAYDTDQHSGLDYLAVGSLYLRAVWMGRHNGDLRLANTMSARNVRAAVVNSGTGVKSRSFMPHLPA